MYLFSFYSQVQVGVVTSTSGVNLDFSAFFLEYVKLLIKNKQKNFREIITDFFLLSSAFVHSTHNLLSSFFIAHIVVQYCP